MMMRRFLPAFLLLIVAAPAFAADPGSSGWICNTVEPNSASITIDSGSSRKLVYLLRDEANVDITITTFTIGGQAATETYEYLETAATADAETIVWIWNEAAIAAMSGTTGVYTDSNSNTKSFCYATIVDATQDAVGGFLDTQFSTGDATEDVTTTSAAGDYVVVSAIGSAAGTTFTGWDTLTEVMDDDGGGQPTRFGLASGDGGDGTTTVTTSGNINITMVSLVFENAAPSGPTFADGPIITPIANGWNVAGTITGSGTLTVEAVFCNPGDGDPNNAELEAGQCGGGNAALLNCSAVWTTGVPNDFDCTGTHPWPSMEGHVAGTDGTNDTAVTSPGASLRSEDTGQGIVTLASVDPTSPFAVQTVANCDTTDESNVLTGCGDTSWLQEGMRVNLSAGFADLTNVIVEDVSSGTITLEAAANSTESNITVTQEAYFATTVAAGDVAEIDDNAAGGNTDVVTLATDGTISFTPTNPGVYTTIDYNVQDVSHASDGDLSPVQWVDGDDKFHLFSERPAFDGELGIEPALLYVGVALSDMSLPCTDDDGQATSITSRTAMPSGTSLAASGAWTGTADTEDEAGVEIVLDCADTGQLYASPVSIFVHVTNDEIPAPDCVTGGVNVAECLAVLDPLRGWLDSGDQLTATFVYSPTVASGDIISQDPVASGTLAAENDPLEVVVSLGVQPDGDRRKKLNLGLGLDISMIFEPTNAVNDEFWHERIAA